MDILDNDELTRRYPLKEWHPPERYAEFVTHSS